MRGIVTSQGRLMADNLHPLNMIVLTDVCPSACDAIAAIAIPEPPALEVGIEFRDHITECNGCRCWQDDTGLRIEF